MLKNLRFIMMTGAVMVVYFAPIVIEASSIASVKKEEVKKDMRKKKKCNCGKQNGADEKT